MTQPRHAPPAQPGLFTANAFTSSWHLTAEAAGDKQLIPIACVYFCFASRAPVNNAPAARGQCVQTMCE